MKRLDGKVAIVTGAAQGLGATFARALAGAGARVCVCDVLDPAPVVAQIAAGGGTALARVVDVTDRAAVDAMVRATEEAYGGIDVLVNNAAYEGSPVPKPFTELTDEDWERTLAINVRGTFACVRAVVPGMRRRGSGKIVNLTSALVFRGNTGMLQYLASKGAILAMTRGLARELGDDGICVNALAPGRTLSEAARRKGAGGESVLSLRALKRDELPEDLIGALLFLASPDSDFMTGQTLVVDGGAVTH